MCATQMLTLDAPAVLALCKGCARSSLSQYPLSHLPPLTSPGPPALAAASESRAPWPARDWSLDLSPSSSSEVPLRSESPWHSRRTRTAGVTGRLRLSSGSTSCLLQARRSEKSSLFTTDKGALTAGDAATIRWPTPPVSFPPVAFSVSLALAWSTGEMLIAGMGLRT